MELDLEFLDFLFQTTTGHTIITFLISMVPVIELRGAIPYGIARGLNPVTAYVAGTLGNMVPVPFILLLIEVIFKWLKKFDFFRSKIEFLEEHADSKGDLIRKYKMLGLCILVAIPFPGTGAWTGALVAALMKLKMKNALPVIFLGVLIAGVIVLFGSLGIASAVGAARTVL